MRPPLSLTPSNTNSLSPHHTGTSKLSRSQSAMADEGSGAHAQQVQREERGAGSSLISTQLMPPTSDALSPSPSLPSRSVLLTLPPDVWIPLLEFLPKSDVGAMLRASKHVNEAVALALRKWNMRSEGNAEAAAARFLRRTRHLQDLSLITQGPDSALIDTFGSGSVGRHLTSLVLVGEVGHCALIVDHLRDGRLPNLILLSFNSRLTFTGPDDCGLAHALEKRARLGLPPLQYGGGVSSLNPDLLRRI